MSTMGVQAGHPMSVQRGTAPLSECAQLSVTSTRALLQCGVEGTVTAECARLDCDHLLQHCKV